MKPHITQDPGGLWICRCAGTNTGSGTDAWKAYCSWLSMRPYREWPLPTRAPAPPGQERLLRELDGIRDLLERRKLQRASHWLTGALTGRSKDHADQSGT